MISEVVQHCCGRPLQLGQERYIITQNYFLRVILIDVNVGGLSNCMLTYVRFDFKCLPGNFNLYKLLKCPD